MTDKQKKLLEDILGVKRPTPAEELLGMFGSVLGFQQTVTVQAPAPKPAKITVDCVKETVKAVSVSRAAAYVELGWNRLAVIKSNGKPIAELLQWWHKAPPKEPENS